MASSSGFAVVGALPAVVVMPRAVLFVSTGAFVESGERAVVPPGLPGCSGPPGSEAPLWVGTPVASSDVLVVLPCVWESAVTPEEAGGATGLEPRSGESTAQQYRRKAKRQIPFHIRLSASLQQPSGLSSSVNG